jgi:hypothetical protein
MQKLVRDCLTGKDAPGGAALKCGQCLADLARRPPRAPLGDEAVAANRGFARPASVAGTIVAVFSPKKALG